VQVFVNDRPVGKVTVSGGFADYRLDLPPDLAAEAAASPDPVLVRLQCSTWVPKDLLGGSDDRPLGIMLDRIRVE
jgi:hypothetical protein